MTDQDLNPGSTGEFSPAESGWFDDGIRPERLVAYLPPRRKSRERLSVLWTLFVLGLAVLVAGSFGLGLLVGSNQQPLEVTREIVVTQMVPATVVHTSAPELIVVTATPKPATATPTMTPTPTNTRTPTLQPTAQPTATPNRMFGGSFG